MTISIETMSETTSRVVELSQITVTFSLPADFGQGWDYDMVHTVGGAYVRTEVRNFAHSAVCTLKGLQETSFCPGYGCSASFEVESLNEAAGIVKQLEALVAAFPSKKSEQVEVRGSNYWDSLVKVYTDHEEDPVIDMPLIAYLILHVPKAGEWHPALVGDDLEKLLAEYQVAT